MGNWLKTENQLLIKSVHMYQ